MRSRGSRLRRSLRGCYPFAAPPECAARDSIPAFLAERYGFGAFVEAAGRGAVCLWLLRFPKAAARTEPPLKPLNHRLCRRLPV